jgi:hypothetical protein
MSEYQLLQNVQHRLAMAENAIAFLTNEVQRLSGTQNAPRNASQTQYALHASQPHASQTYASQPHASQSLQTAIPLQPARRPYANPRAPQAQPQDQAPISLSEILTTDEVVTFGIFTGRDENGIKTSTVLATFDGSSLTVTECDTVRSLIGLKTSKAGEILFKFMNGLKEAGLIENTFNALPWRLASVQRDGQKVTLAQLRALKA